MQASIIDKAKIQNLESNIKVIWHIPYKILWVTLVFIVLYMISLSVRSEVELQICGVATGINLLLLIIVKLSQKKDDKYIEQIYRDIKQIHNDQFSAEIKPDTKEKWDNFNTNELEEYALGCIKTLKEYRDKVLDNLIALNKSYNDLLDYLCKIKSFTWMDDCTVDSIHKEYINKCMECSKAIIKVVYESPDKNNIFTKEWKIDLDELLKSLDNKAYTKS